MKSIYINLLTIFPMKYFKTVRGTLVSTGLKTTLLSLLLSCSELVEIDPPKNQITPTQIFGNDQSASSAITGIYSRMRSVGFSSGNSRSISFLMGLSSDELINYQVTPDYVQFFTNELSPTNGLIKLYLWNEVYQYIYSANSILMALSQDNAITRATRNQLEGEAKFIRAFCYFYLANMFGDVPLHTTADYRANSVAERTSVKVVYEQVISDLQDAENLLSDGYITTERVRPNKWAAKALLARTYLFTGDWEMAEIEATAVIDNTTYYNLATSLDDVFLKNSSEAIWQLMPEPGRNTNEGDLFILNTNPEFGSLNAAILDDFEAGDNRKSKWIDSISVNGVVYYFPYKYKVDNSALATTEYSMVLRLAEQYLIRAEARAQQAKLAGINSAEADLNTIRNRSGLGNTTAQTQDEILNAVLHERKLELFTEWGHRWLDLKRTGKITGVLGQIKGSTWQENDALFPISQDEIERNRNIEQNAGY